MRAGVGHGPMTIAEFPCTTPCEHSDHMTPNGGRGWNSDAHATLCHVTSLQRHVGWYARHVMAAE